MFAGNLGSKGAYVTKEEPTRVYFAEALRREEIELLQAIYIDGQVRIVIEVESIEAAWVKVESPFTIYEKSNDDYIVLPGSNFYVVKRRKGNGMTCAATDMPQISSIYSANPTAKLSTIVVDEEDNIITEKTTRSRDLSLLRITPHDPHEIEIGDRIRVNTRDPSSDIKCGVQGDLSCGTFQTHTVEKIFYETTNDQSSNSLPPDLRTIGSPREFYLNAYVNTPSSAKTLLDPKTKKYNTITKYVPLADGEERAVYNDQRGTLEDAECGNRGICDRGTGLCRCFKNFVGDDCSKMEHLPSL